LCALDIVYNTSTYNSSLAAAERTDLSHDEDNDCEKRSYTDAGCRFNGGDDADCKDACCQAILYDRVRSCVRTSTCMAICSNVVFCPIGCKGWDSLVAGVG